jgi:hypothetical protein
MTCRDCKNYRSSTTGKVSQYGSVEWIARCNLANKVLGTSIKSSAEKEDEPRPPSAPSWCPFRKILKGLPEDISKTAMFEKMKID